MEKHKYVGKTLEEALNQAKIDLLEQEENLIYKELEIKSGLFKSKKAEIEVVTKLEVIEFIKKYLKELTNNIGIHINIEVKNREKNIIFTLFSDNNAMLIGKMGRTMEALNIVAKQAVASEIECSFPFIIDVSEYKEKQQKNIERIAKQIAREVAKTKIPAKLDPMNSYERRLVHTVLADNKRVYTESEGSTPNRYVIIKPKEEE